MVENRITDSFKAVMKFEQEFCINKAIIREHECNILLKHAALSLRKSFMLFYDQFQLS